MIASDLPPNLATLVTAVLVSTVTVGLPLLVANRRNRDATRAIARNVEAVHEAVRDNAADVQYSLAASNGGIGGQVRIMSERITELLQQVGDGQHTADETGMQVARLFHSLSEHLRVSERVHEDIRNELRTHFESIGHEEFIEVLTRVVEDIKGPDAALTARVIQSEVREAFAKRRRELMSKSREKP